MSGPLKSTVAAARSAEKAAIDPITVEVIGSSLSSIVEEMNETLICAAHSTTVKERRDCSTAILAASGSTVCQNDGIPMLLGCFIEFIPHVLKHHRQDEIKPGDVFIGNDAYNGGPTHLQDIVLAEPIFVDDRLVGWAINTAHHQDFADRGHAHIFQEGIRIPPIRLYRAGALEKDVLDFVLLNCQVPAERESDFQAQMAANRLGVQRTIALCRKYGTDIVLDAGEALQNYADRKMRAGIGAIPDGTYRFKDTFETSETGTEIMDVSCEIRVRGDEMHLHFESPPQLRAGLNVVRTALLTTVYYVVKSIVDPTVLPNSGLARAITVTAPEGTLLNCSEPAALYARNTTCQRVADLIHGALAQVVPQQVMAACNGACFSSTFSGVDPRTGKTWIYLETHGGGSGARATKDGLDGVHVHVVNTSNLPLESLELEYPLTLLRYELVEGSGGAGEHRGGLGLRRVYRAETDCLIRLVGSRMSTAPWGLFGGQNGRSGEFLINGRPAQLREAYANLKTGDVLDIVTPGAGGYGEPKNRDRESVERDVRERLITPAFAAAVYGI